MLRKTSEFVRPYTHLGTISNSMLFSKPISTQGTEYVYESNWGEQLSSVVNPLPVVLDLDSEECTVLDVSKVGDISCENFVFCSFSFANKLFFFSYVYIGGQAHWVLNDDGGVVFVGWENKPRKLGFVYCMCRK